jgi:hypothetical protein
MDGHGVQMFWTFIDGIGASILTMMVGSVE